MISLVLTRFRPDRPSGGAALRNWQNIQALRRLGPVDVLSIGAEATGEDVPGIRRWMAFSFSHLSAARSKSARVAARLWPLRPGCHPSIAAYDFADVRTALRASLAEASYGVAVIEELSLASYAGLLKQAGCCVVFDAHNVESAIRAQVQEVRAAGAASIRSRVRDRLLETRLTEAEGRAVALADVVWACSQEDAEEIRRRYGAAEVTVVPNGVDVDAYQRPAAPHAGEDWRALPMTLVYPGSYSYFPNADAAMRLVDHVLPALRSRGCDPRVVLVGRSPSAAMLRAAQRDAAVQVTGTVDSVLPYLQQPCVVVLPISLGSGTRLKILEAFATGCPVVSTRKGAEGLDAIDGTHLLIRESSDEMAQAVVDLWMQPNLRTELCANGRDLVRANFSWPVAAERITDSLRRVLGARASTVDSQPLAVNCGPS